MAAGCGPRDRKIRAVSGQIELTDSGVIPAKKVVKPGQAKGGFGDDRAFGLLALLDAENI